MKQKINIKINKPNRERKIEDEVNQEYSLFCREAKPIIVNDKKGIAFVMGVSAENDREDRGMGMIMLNGFSKAQALVHFTKALNLETEDYEEAKRIAINDSISHFGQIERIID